MDALLSKTEDLSLEEAQKKTALPGLIRLPAEIRNAIYEMCTTTKRSYTLQYPRASGMSDLLRSNIFQINHQTRAEALSTQCDGSSITIEPRRGFYTPGIPRVLSRLPSDILKSCSSIEVYATVQAPFSWFARDKPIELRFVVGPEGFYHTEAWYYRCQYANLLPKEVDELKAYVEKMVVDLEMVMLKALEGKEMRRGEDGRRISITLIKK